MNKSLILLSLVTVVTLINTYQSIIIPYILFELPSAYLFQLIQCSQMFFIFFVWNLIVNKSVKPTLDWSVIFAGVFMAGMNICTSYASEPSRVPPPLQPLITSTSLIWSAIGKKIFIDKRMTYRRWYLLGSVICLAISIFVPFGLEANSMVMKDIYWIFIFFASIICLSLSSVFQEKYLSKNEDNQPIMIKMLYTISLVQFIMVLTSVWIEYLLYPNPMEMFNQSVSILFSNWVLVLLMELFIVLSVISFNTSASLSSISANYVSITWIIANPLANIIYFIVPLGYELSYPWYVVMIVCIINVIGSILWIKGEQQEDDDNIIDDIESLSLLNN